ncbi:MAG: DUF6088 family protein [Vicinamibacterales bacterium]
MDVGAQAPGGGGTIRQLGRGLYDYPKPHPSLGQLSPTPDALAKAMAGRDRVRRQPSGAYAANLLGLSEQVPAKVVFLTDGPSQVVHVGDEAVARRGLAPVIVEKDFWVCWLLGILFQSSFRDAIVFKGDQCEGCSGTRPTFGDASVLV